MLRIKALFRARAIRTPGRQVYEAETRGRWLDRLPERGCRFRADTLAAELDLLRQLRRDAKAAMLAVVRKDPAYELLCTIPFFGPVRVAQLLATMQTPWRFRTKRNLWAYAGLAVVTHSSADYTIVEGRPVRSVDPTRERRVKALTCTKPLHSLQTNRGRRGCSRLCVADALQSMSASPRAGVLQEMKVTTRAGALRSATATARVW
jgi:transposase